jgi:hypothetical protein
MRRTPAPLVRALLPLAAPTLVVAAFDTSTPIS